MNEELAEKVSDPLRMSVNSPLNIFSFVRDVVRAVIKITVETIISLFGDDYNFLLRDYFGIDLFITEVPPIVDCFKTTPLASEGPTFITSHSHRGMHSMKRCAILGNRSLLLNVACGGR